MSMQAAFGEMETDNTEKLLAYWFAKFRTDGFPHPDAIPPAERRLQFTKLCLLDYDSIVNGKIIKQTTDGNDLAWSYFSHRWNIRCNKMRTPVEVFENDEFLTKVLRKCLTYDDQISPTVLRHWLTKFSGTQVVSNFRPTAAGGLYRHFLPKPIGKDMPLYGETAKPLGVVWDMSSGFGGRLLGAMACGSVAKYIGTDPSTPTFSGLQKMAAELGPLSSTVIELHQLGSEIFTPERESLDLCFTSPPYFDCEKYSDDEGQSFKKYSTQELWLNGFMAGTLDNCYHGLKCNGTLAINIAAVKSYPTVCEDLVELATLIGFRHTDTMQLTLRKIPGSHNATSKGNHEVYKYEPVFVFRKA